MLVWTQQETTITLDNRGVLLAGVCHTMVASMTHLQSELCLNTLHTSSSHACVNNACMFYAQYASIVVWKSQNGAETQVNFGARKKLTCFDPLRKGCGDFF
jgi:hypothetical protein